MTAANPKFRPDILEHFFEENDGSRSIVLEDPVANKYFRISPYEFELLKVLDGKLNLKEALERLKLHGRHFSLGHAAKLVDQFSKAGLLLGTSYGGAKYQIHFKNVMDKAVKQRSLLKLYYLYIPLLNPDRFLAKTLWIWRLVVNWFTFAIFLALIPGAVFLLIDAIPRLREEFLFFFNWENLIVLWIAIALVKLIHEFSHAYTAKSLGLRVPEMGIAMLMFFPCLYCNTTAAWELADRKQRMSIAMAGILSETVVAVFSVYIWYFTQPGLVNSVTFFLAIISVVSSLFFNGNPLLKFDGYFVLIDWLRFPNLQGKSFAQLRYLFLNRVLGLEAVTPPTATGKEVAMITAYGISALVYRFFLYTGIVAGVYLRFDKTIGIILGALIFSLLIVRPLTRSAGNLSRQRSQMNFRPAGVTVFGAIVALGILALVIPWSSNSVYPCHLESAVVRQIVVPADAPIAEAPVREGDRVEAGQVILRLDPKTLEYSLKDKETERRLKLTEIAITETSDKDLSKLRVQHIELAQIEDAIRKIKEDLGNLEFKAPFTGAVSRLSPMAQPGARPGKGAVVGELADETKCQAQGLVPEYDVDKARQGAPVEVWFPIEEGKKFKLKVTEILPFKAEDLEGSPFSSRFGGEIATQAKEASQKDAPLQPYYLCKVDLENKAGVPLGMTGRLVVHEAPKSMLTRIVEAAYQTFHREILF